MMKRCSLWGKNDNGTVTATGQIQTVFFYSDGRILENRELKNKKIDHGY